MPATTVTIPTFAGLYVQANSFAAVPDGALEIAEEVTGTRDGILQKRRGFFEFSTGVSSQKRLYEYRATLILAWSTKLSKIDSAGTVTDFTGALSWATIVARFAQSQGTLFLTSDAGVKCVESLTDSVRSAGIAPGLDLEVTISGQTGPVEPDSRVGYRVCFGRDDANGLRSLGAPSAFAEVINAMTTSLTASLGGGEVTVTHATHGYTGPTFTIVVKDAVDGSGNALAGANGEYTATYIDAGSYKYTPAGAATGIASCSTGVYKTAALDFTVPSADLSVSHFYQIYRSDSSGDSTVAADEDTLKLAAEVLFGSGDLTAGYVSFSDDIADLFRGAYLYTNPNTQQGIINSNLRPPLCQTMVEFKNTMFFGNIKRLFRLDLSLISASDMAINDTLAITLGAVTRTYTAKAAEVAASQQFKLTNSSGSVGFDIDQTARSICKVINRDPSGVVWAYYISGPLDVPGAITLEARSYGVAFTATANDGSPYFPNIQTTTTATQAVGKNIAAFAKKGQPHAVPIYQELPIASKDENLLCFFALRDSIIVVKEQSIHRINGDDGNFTAILLDGTLTCRAPDSFVTLNNEVWGVTDQGIVAISESGACIVSRQIEPLLTSILGQTAFYNLSQAVAYESERLYILSTISDASKTTPDICYVWNTVTNAPTVWKKPFLTAIVKRADDKLHFAFSTKIFKERKNQDRLDYSDNAYSTTIVSVSTDKLEAYINQTVGTLTAGDAILLNNVVNRVVDVDNSGVVPLCSFELPVNFVNGSTVGHYKAILSKIRTCPLTMGNVGIMKHYTDIQIHPRTNSATRMNIRFVSDSVAGSVQTIWQTNYGQAGWGLSPWGLFEWGLPQSVGVRFQTSPAQPLRTFVPIECAKSTWLQVELTHSEACEPWDLQALSIKARPMTSRTTR